MTTKPTANAFLKRRIVSQNKDAGEWWYQFAPACSQAAVDLKHRLRPAEDAILRELERALEKYADWHSRNLGGDGAPPTIEYAVSTGTVRVQYDPPPQPGAPPPKPKA